jgi:hypothetical protein
MSVDAEKYVSHVPQAALARLRASTGRDTAACSTSATTSARRSSADGMRGKPTSAAMRVVAVRKPQVCAKNANIAAIPFHFEVCRNYSRARRPSLHKLPSDSPA